MRLFLPSIFACIALSTPAVAQGLSYPVSCTGQSPDWTLDIAHDGAVFNLARESELTIALDTPALDAEWPRALTLIGRGDSAIVILENRACESGDLTARILTQRGETPLLLTGCCQMPKQ